MRYPTAAFRRSLEDWQGTTPRALLCGRAYEVGDTFCLRQIKFAVKEGAHCEFSRLGQTSVHLETALEEKLQHCGTAVALQLKYVFAGVGMGCRKKQGHALIKGLALCIKKGNIGRTAWGRSFA